MAVTIKQIAELAGVSRGTVDRALNHRAGVKKEVAERILQIAKELNYRPNAVAKALANTNKPCLIGVLMNSDGNEFFDEVTNCGAGGGIPRDGRPGTESPCWRKKRSGGTDLADRQRAQLPS